MPYTNNQGLRIYYKIEGEGPPLMLLHGYSMTSDDWYEFGYVAELKKNYQLIVMDARGYGASDKPHEPDAYLWKFLAEDVIAVLDDLQLNQIYYWGWSEGGKIAFALAKYAPQRLKAVIIGGIYAPEAKKPNEPNPLLDLLNDSGATGMVKIWKEHLTISSDHETRLSNLDIDALKAERQVLRSSLVDIPPKMRMPCMIYVGEEDGNYPAAKADSQRISNCTFVSFPGFNHFDAWARSDVVLPPVTKFLAEVSE